jgi:hypothetical protein
VRGVPAPACRELSAAWVNSRPPTPGITTSVTSRWIGRRQIPAALAVWALARHDLALIRRGRMDPAGELEVRDGGRWAAAGAVVAALGSCVSIIVWLSTWRV